MLPAASRLLDPGVVLAGADGRRAGQGGLPDVRDYDEVPLVGDDFDLVAARGQTDNTDEEPAPARPTWTGPAGPVRATA